MKLGILSNISVVILFLSLFLFLFSKIEIGKEKKIFLLYIIVAFLSEIVTHFTAVFHIRNVWFGHFFFPMEFLLFFLILLQWENRYRKYWIAAGALVGTYVSLDNFLLTDFSKFPVIAMSIQNFFLFLFSTRMLIELTTRNFIPFYKDERFYIVAGIFIYTCMASLMNLFFNLFSVYFPSDLMVFAGLSLNLLLTYAMVLYYRQRKMLAEALK